MKRLRKVWAQVRRVLAASWPEILTAAALLLGWGLLTWGIADLIRRSAVWPLSGGLLCITLFGWRLLLQIGRDGLYALTRRQ